MRRSDNASAPVAELAMERERSLDGLARLVQPALPQAQHAQGAEGARLASPVAHPAMDRERRLEVLARFVESADLLK